jgi:hypothetical protein
MRNPPKDGGGFTISGSLKSFEGPVLNLGTVENTVCLCVMDFIMSYLNELEGFR